MTDIRIILVNPSHPGNIGAAARAMKAMGLKCLYLVNPKSFPNANATAMAAGADDILSETIVTSSLAEALISSKIVFGTSARLRALSLPTVDPKKAAKIIVDEAKNNNIAILFGRENNGLTNEELAMCNYHIHIPTNPNFSSLNIASAVQIIAYEIKNIEMQDSTITIPKIELANTEDIQAFYQHLQQTLLAINFLHTKNQNSLMAKLKRLFNRAQLEKTEISILRGILTIINKVVKKMKTRHPVYLDYMATTPLDPRVRQKMLPYLGSISDGIFGNPSSKHHYGYQAKVAVEDARSQVATLINCDPKSIIWTSGATEANNLAIKGAGYFYQRQGKHIITCKTEHKSVLDTCKYLETQGFEITYLTPESDGLIDLNKLEQTFRPDTILVSIMHVNNEIGVIQNIAKISELTRSKGILLHVDAAQSVGKIPIDLQKLKVDLMSFSGHKIYGPKGVGALYIRSQPKLHLTPQIHGGAQENNLRAGTLATHQIVGMGEAFRLAALEITEENRRLQKLREKLWQGIKNLGDVYVNGSISNRVSSNLNISFGNIDGELLLAALKDIAVSSTSACIKDTGTSYVLKAIGVLDKLALNTIRISLGRFTTEEDIDIAIKHISEVVVALRNCS